MDVKMIEIRDRATFIVAVAVRLTSGSPREFYLLRRAGYSAEQIARRDNRTPPYVLLTRAEGGDSNYDQFSWGNRTMFAVHDHLINHWNEITSGDVIDVEFFLGETSEPKISEEFTNG